MAYTERDWDNTGTKVTKEDFERMETGIKNNDNAITEQAQKIEENTNQINVLSERTVKYEKVLSSINIDDVVEQCEGWVEGVTSSGSVSGNGYFKHMRYAFSNDYAYQEFTHYGTNVKLSRLKINGVWQPWQQIATTEMTYGVRLFSGSITAISGTLQLSDSLLNYKELIINFGNVAAGKNQALSFKSYNYPGNIRSISEDLFMPILVGGVWYRLYIKPDTDTTKLYYELRNLDESAVTSNPATSYFCIRYVVGVK